MKQLQFDFVNHPYTEDEMAHWTDNTDFDMSLIPLWRLLWWGIVGPPWGTGPR